MMGEMSEYKIKVKICSEAIFNSGERERNLVQTKVLSDPYGFVYFHAKTLKGQLKRQAFWLLKQYAKIDYIKGTNHAASFIKSYEKLFGEPNEDEKEIIKKYVKEYESKWKSPGLMRLSNLELDIAIRNYFINLQNEDKENDYYRISPHDLIEAQTNIRTNIQLDDGIVKDKMFHSFHTVKDGLTFYSTISFEEDVSETNEPDLLKDLSRIIRSFRRIGAGIHRGRGEIEAHLLFEDTDICCR
nr:RAMP superfamily CRISPR-associated protein [Acetivibrio straminisolvens]